MPQRAIQLWTLRDLDESLPALLNRVGETELDGVELAGLGATDVEDVAAAISRNDLEIAAAHVGIEPLESDLESTIEPYQALGVDRLVIPMIDASEFDSRAAIEHTAERLTTVAAELGEHDIDLLYHNHAHEFEQVGDETAFDVLVRETDGVSFELDIGWAFHAGIDPAPLLDRIGDRTPLIHVTDVDIQGDHAAVGRGVVPVAACLDVARTHGSSWFIYENDEPEDPIAELEHADEFLAAKP